MKLCNDTITIFNKRVDPEVGGDVLKHTVIRGVSWHATDASTVDASKGGLVAANKIVIRIPEDADAGGKAYADPIAYKAAADVSGLWTLTDGAIIAKGEVPATPPTGAWTQAKLKAAYPCAVALAVTDNRRAPNAPHWRVTGT